MASPVFPLRKLPFELRNRIYEFAAVFLGEIELQTVNFGDE
jgi:hypothetical protein